MNLKIFRKKVEKVNIQNYIVWQNEMMLDEYFKKESFENRLFPIYSCTKSILGLLIGIAIDQKILPSEKIAVNHYIPEMKNSDLQIHHLLAMTSGIDWPELNLWNGKLKYILRPDEDWLEFITKRSFFSSPGSTFNYSSADSFLLGVLLTRASGKSLTNFAKEYLFSPLEISDYLWEKNNSGFYWGGSGIRMKSKDFGKIGLLCLNDGNWQGKQIVSANWINKSFQSQSAGIDYLGNYGFHWWNKTVQQYKIYFAAGMYGQYLYIIPRLGLVVVFRSLLKKGQLIPEILLRKYLLA